MTDLPIELGIPAHLKLRAEWEAMERARRWVAADPFYTYKGITMREEALMRLALRCLTHPTDTDIAQVDLESREAQGRRRPAPRW